MPVWFRRVSSWGDNHVFDVPVQFVREQNPVHLCISSEDGTQ